MPATSESRTCRSTSSAISMPTSSFGEDYIEYLLGKFEAMPELGVAGTHYIEGDFHSFRDSYINVASRQRADPAVPPGLLRGHRRLRADQGRRNRLGGRHDGAHEGLDDATRSPNASSITTARWAPPEAASCRPAFTTARRTTSWAAIRCGRCFAARFRWRRSRMFGGRVSARRLHVVLDDAHQETHVPRTHVVPPPRAGSRGANRSLRGADD